MARHGRHVRRRVPAPLAVVAAAAVVAGLAWGALVASGGPPHAPGHTLAAASTSSSAPHVGAPPTSVAPARTSTTLPAGMLPQTHALPPAAGPSLTHRLRALLAAVASGDVRRGMAAFFPLAAYVQTKAYADAAYDWSTRLVPEYGTDLELLHRELDPEGRPLQLMGYAVDDPAAVWVLPGEEYNKGPYWRVYDTVVAYRLGTERGSFTVSTMISWRGQWYVVHVAGVDS